MPGLARRRHGGQVAAVLLAVALLAGAGGAGADAANSLSSTMQKYRNLHFATVSTRDNPDLAVYRDQARAQGGALIVLGLAENREIGYGKGRSGLFGAKLSNLQTFVSSPWLNPLDVVLYTDAYDVFLNGNLSTVLNRFTDFENAGHRIVFGSEIFCWPEGGTVHAETYPITPPFQKEGLEFPYLNAGMVIGQVGALRDCYIGWTFDEWENDQKFWHERYITPVGACKIALDHGNRIFLNTNGLTDPRRNSENYTFVDGKFKYRNLDPLLVHSNGGPKTVVPWLRELAGIKSRDASGEKEATA